MEEFKYTLDVIVPMGIYGYLIKKTKLEPVFDENNNINHKEIYKYNIINSQGILVADEWFDCYKIDGMGNCVIGYKDNEVENKFLYGAINDKGVMVLSPIYDNIEFSTEGTFIIYRNDLCGYVEQSNGNMITPICFEKCYDFQDGKALVCYDSQYGYADRNKIITNPLFKWEYRIFPQFDKAYSFKKGVAEVIINGQKRYINGDGVIITQMVMKLIRGK